MYLEPYDRSDRVAAVTGDGRNIGLAAAHAWAEVGATPHHRQDRRRGRPSRRQEPDRLMTPSVVVVDGGYTVW